MHRIIFYAVLYNSQMVTSIAEQDQDIKNKKQAEDPDEVEIGQAPMTSVGAKAQQS